MHRNDVFTRFHRALADHWQPYLDGKTEMDAAIGALIGDLNP